MGVFCRNGVFLHECVIPLVAQPGLHAGLMSTCSCRAGVWLLEFQRVGWKELLVAQEEFLEAVELSRTLPFHSAGTLLLLVTVSVTLTCLSYTTM